MKQKLRLLMLTLLCAVVSTAWGEETAYKTLTFSSSTNGSSVQDYTSTWTATIDNFTWTLKYFNNNQNNWSYVKCGRKNNASTATITTNSAIDKAITKVVVTIDALTASKVNSTKLEVASDAGFTSDLQTKTLANPTTGENTYEVPIPTENQYYRLTYDCASGSSNGLVTISKVIYYYNEGDQPQPSGDKYYVAGSWTDWQNGKIQMTKRSDGSYTLTNQQLAADAEFKIIKEAEGETELVWYGGDTNDQYYWVTPDNHTDMSLIVKSGEYANFQIKNAGTWTFTVDPTGTTPKISVDGNWPEANYYLMGDFNKEGDNWLISDSYKFSDDGTGNYTLNKPIKLGEKFKIIKSYDQTVDDNDTWYGAVSTGDFFFNAEYVGTELSLTTENGGENFYMNLSNKKDYWILEFNPENAKLKLSNYVSDVAELPFVFDGGRNDIPDTPGLTTTTGLGSGYSTSPKLQFKEESQALVLHFGERPGTLSFDIKGNSFSEGEFVVQTSEDGETYNDLKSYTTLSQATTGQHETFDNLGENVRYIQWLYKRKSNGNVALGNIKLEKYVAPQSYTVTITQPENAEIFVFYNDLVNTPIEDGDEVMANSEVLVSVSVTDEDYEIESVTVTDGNGQSVTMTDVVGEEGTAWTFIMPSSDVTVACTVTKIPEPSNEEWVLTDLADLTEDDIFVIVGNDGQTRAMTNDATASSLPGTVNVYISNDRINTNTTPVTDNIKWNISGDATNGYTFYPSGTTVKWLYTTNDTKGVHVGTNDNKLFKLKDGYLYNLATARYVGIYSQNEWRCYTSTTTNISGQTFGFYKLVKPLPDPFTFTIDSRAADESYYYATIADLGEGYFKVVGDMEVRTATILDGKLSYPTTYYKGDVFPGNGAYLVVADKSVGAGQHTFPAVVRTVPNPVDNMLYSTGSGSLTAAEMEAKPQDGGNYLFYKLSLNKNHKKIGFYWGAEGGAAFDYGKGHQAFLAVPKAGDSGDGAAAYLFDGDKTGIYSIKATESESNNATYTLSGIRVDNKQLPKGIYIKNGKKVVVR